MSDRQRLVETRAAPSLGWATVLSSDAWLDEWGAWKVRKAKQSRKIDGLVASVIAHSRAVYAKPKKTALMTSNPW